MATRGTGDPHRKNSSDGQRYFSQPGDLGGDMSYRGPSRVKRSADSYSDPGYYNGYDDGAYYDDNSYDGYTGYPQDYYEEDNYQSSYYDEGYYYEEPEQRGPTMASRAVGKQNTEIYGRPQRARKTVQPPARQHRTSAYDYEEDYVPRKTRRRKKRHPFRNFMLFLLIVGGLLAAIYFLLFRAPDAWEDGIHTRRDGIYNILICATDEEELRTDTIMIATLDRENGGIFLTSLPRDTIVDNGQAVPKLNGVFGLAGGGDAGAQAMMDEIQELLGFRPDGYAIINYDIFRDAVDAMGGVVFDVPMDMEVDDPDTGENFVIYAGEQLLDGDLALGVCRYRYGYMMADIQRQYVQQSFLKAMIQQMMTPENLTAIPAVYAAAMDNVQTDLSGANIRYLALHALLGGVDNIQQNTLPGEGVDYNGASCFGLYGQSVVDMVNETMNPFVEDITIEDVHILTVSGGTLVESTWTGTPFDASQYQYD